MDKAVRQACVDRSEGLCEACKQPSRFPLQADHFFGRKHAPENERTVWMLDMGCHADKTANRPSRIHWFQVFARHACIHGYVEEQARALREVAWMSTKAELRKRLP